MSLTADRVRIKPASSEDAPNSQLQKAPLRRGGWGEKVSRRNTALARALLAASAALIELFVVLCAALIGETFYHGFAHGWSGLIPPNMRLCSLVALLFVVYTSISYSAVNRLTARMLEWAPPSQRS